MILPMLRNFVLAIFIQPEETCCAVLMQLIPNNSFLNGFPIINHMTERLLHTC